MEHAYLIGVCTLCTFALIYDYTYAKFVDCLRKYTSSTKTVAKIPLIDSISLNILQALKSKFAKINERGVQKRSGVGEFPKLNKRGRRLLSTKRNLTERGRPKIT